MISRRKLITTLLTAPVAVAAAEVVPAVPFHAWSIDTDKHNNRISHNEDDGGWSCCFGELGENRETLWSFVITTSPVLRKIFDDSPGCVPVTPDERHWEMYHRMVKIEAERQQWLAKNRTISFEEDGTKVETFTNGRVHRKKPNGVYEYSFPVPS